MGFFAEHNFLHVCWVVLIFCCQVEDLEQFTVYVSPTLNVMFPVQYANNSPML